MLARLMASTTETPIPDLLAELDEVLKAVKPRGLVEAENALNATRDELAAAQADSGRISHELYVNQRLSTPELEAADRRVSAAQKVTQSLRDRLQEARAAAAPAIVVRLDKFLALAARELVAASDRLRTAQAILARIDDVTYRSGLVGVMPAYTRTLPATAAQLTNAAYATHREAVRRFDAEKAGAAHLDHPGS